MTLRFNTGKAPWISILLVAGAFLLLAPRLQAQYEYDANCRKAYEAILALRFAEAHNLIALEKKADPGNLLPVYLENFIDFLTLTIGEERVVYDRLKARKAERVKLLEKGRDDSPFHNFCLGEVHLQWALARLKFGDYTAAAIEIQKAYVLFSENETKYPSFMINKMGMGVVHVVLSLVPDKYQWVRKMAGLDGSVELGLAGISRVAAYSGNDKITLMYKPQAAFLLAFLALNLKLDKKEAMQFLDRLQTRPGSDRLPTGPLMVYARATILMKNGLNEEALAVLRERPESPQTFHFYYLDYLEGMTRLNKLDDSASICFNRFITGFRGQNYIRAAYQKLAWSALLRGDSVNYHRLVGHALAKGTPLVDEDKQAAFEAAGGIAPNIILLRARLLFDGGYYNAALDELLNNPVRNTVRSKRDLIEYNYRLGRIWHKLGNDQKAMENYRQTILRGRNEPWYFAAGAAYQTGLLCESTGEYAEAGNAYRVCLSCNPREYKTSLHQKAKAGLKRLSAISGR